MRHKETINQRTDNSLMNQNIVIKVRRLLILVFGL